MSAFRFPPCRSTAQIVPASPPPAAHTASCHIFYSRMHVNCSAAPFTGSCVRTHSSASRFINRAAPQRHAQRNVIRAAGNTVNVGKQDVSPSERFIEELEGAEESVDSGSEGRIVALRDELASLRQQVQDLQQNIDSGYRDAFARISVTFTAKGFANKGNSDEDRKFTDLSEASFGKLGRDEPKVMKLLLAEKEAQDGAGWRAFQTSCQTLKLRRTRALGEVQEKEAVLESTERAVRMRSAAAEPGGGVPDAALLGDGKDLVRIVLMTGFESFNVALYKKAAENIGKQRQGLSIRVFSDRDIASQRQEIEAALHGADVFFGSLLFDYDQVEWMKERIQQIPVRLVFESALELMSMTQLGTFQMSSGGKGPSGPPPVVKKILSLFGSGKEEDKLVGYLSFLKMGPKLLKFLPGKKARDLKNWLTIYGYWNAGGQQNVESMLTFLTEEYLKQSGAAPPAVVETPATGCLHPGHTGYFDGPASYMQWYAKYGPLKDTLAPTVALLLYRKHVLTDQLYIPQLISCLEAQGVKPVPIFINGVEAHTIVRDQLTTQDEQEGIFQVRPSWVRNILRLALQGRLQQGSLHKDAITVDAVVSTVGFPLVGGPAGTMKGGRQADIAKTILSAKNVPYIIAAPLLIQDLASWSRDGVAGLQSVVLYSLPELDGAIDTVPLGGLVGDNIYLAEERVHRLAGRLKKWVNLRRTQPKDRKVAMLLYGFPPGIGSTGTAALLNVPKSLEAMLEALRDDGYDLGPDLGPDGARIDGEAIISALQKQEDQRAVLKGINGIREMGAGDAAAAGFVAVAAEVSPRQLRRQLTFPSTFGPTEFGPIPFLPPPDLLVQRMEAAWGDLDSYRGLSTTASGNFLVSGLQLGNVWIGVQPALGVEGDPMRLLFERDLTPHPQYAAFYKWIQEDFEANAVVHVGMHGTVEWLPGAPLGNSGLSWSDVLLGDLPNIYIYAANNPSESIIAKRRGYGTISSYNVPPYGRSGLYKQLAELKNLVADFRENPEESDSLKEFIVEALISTGLQDDCPFLEAQGSEPATFLTHETVGGVSTAIFSEYASRLYMYLQLVEGRLFSEGLHVLGATPSASQMEQYLSAFFGDDLPLEAVEAVSAGDDLSTVQNHIRTLDALWEKDTENSAGRGDRTPPDYSAKVEEAIRIRGLLEQNTEEVTSVLRGLNGEYILPEAGGDLLRDGAGVLPTGRNIHALDPYRMPSLAALERGMDAGRQIVQAHLDANSGAYPETMAVNLWGLDAIKTKGDSVAIVLYLVGARPVREGTGRIARFELIPLSELGRPRMVHISILPPSLDPGPMDTLCNMSGIFRDSFQNVVELLDDLFVRAAAADEPLELNFIRKHSGAMTAQGLANSTARLFSNPAGDYGSMVNERVGAGNWESGDELGDTWASRNSYSYGRGSERGTARPEVLQQLLATTERVVQQVDSVEYGLTDIQEYFANTGALKRAAENARGGGKVGCTIVEAFGKDVRPRELEEVLRLEYRSKLLNPKWAQAMANQGSGGAFEISQRMTAMIGWGATTKFHEKWVWDQAAETYALDGEMAKKLRESNPQAFTNVLKRMLEAEGRGMWAPDMDTLAKLQNMYSDMDSQLEGIV